MSIGKWGTLGTFMEDPNIARPLRKPGTTPFIARRGREHGSGLGVHRRAVEGVFSWLFKFRRLRVRHEKRDDIQSAFLVIGCAMTWWNRVQRFC